MAKEASIDNLLFHDLRQCVRVAARDEKGALKTVQEILGHKSLGTTLRNAQLAPEP